MWHERSRIRACIVPLVRLCFQNPIEKVFDKIAEKNITTIASIALSVRVASAEEFGFPPGTIATGKVYAALRALGFDYVLDTNFGADLTIAEEANEFIKRFTSEKNKLPMFTSCCPGWVDYAEKRYHDLLPHLSTTKSPQQIQGVMTKTYFAKRIGADKKNIFNVSIMPCTTKLFESERDKNMSASGVKDYDMVITTRELAHLLREAGIDFAHLKDADADKFMSSYSGAGTIFGATGGVMEAALRTAYCTLTKKRIGTDCI